MPDNTTSKFVSDVQQPDMKHYPIGVQIRMMKAALFPPETDIELWLKHNAPDTNQQLADLRYALYHRCSRAEYKVLRMGRSEFKITGRQSTVVVSNNAFRRGFLLMLRQLVRSRK